jgi:hypothetical protein
MQWPLPGYIGYWKEISKIKIETLGSPSFHELAFKFHPLILNSHPKDPKQKQEC